MRPLAARFGDDENGAEARPWPDASACVLADTILS